MRERTTTRKEESDKVCSYLRTPPAYPPPRLVAPLSQPPWKIFVLDLQEDWNFTQICVSNMIYKYDYFLVFFCLLFFELFCHFTGRFNNSTDPKGISHWYLANTWMIISVLVNIKNAVLLWNCIHYMLGHFSCSFNTKSACFSFALLMAVISVSAVCNMTYTSHG